jgi:hypothetical protein
MPATGSLPKVKRLAITGRTGSGKDFLLRILQAAFPTIADISIGAGVKEHVKTLTPDGKLDRTRDVPLLQTIGKDPSFGWSAKAEQRAKAALCEGMIPVFSDVRTQDDHRMVRRFGCPLIVVTAPRETRIARIMARDHLSRNYIESYIDDPETEGVIDDFTTDHAFRNNGFLTSRELGRLFNFLDGIR